MQRSIDFGGMCSRSILCILKITNPTFLSSPSRLYRASRKLFLLKTSESCGAWRQQLNCFRHSFHIKHFSSRQGHFSYRFRLVLTCKQLLQRLPPAQSRPKYKAAWRTQFQNCAPCWTTPENTITYHNVLCLSPQNLSVSIVFSFSLGHFNSQEKLKTMLRQNFVVTNKEHMVCYGIF